MVEKRFINDVSEILDTYFGYMGTKEPSEREIKEKDYLLIGVARSQRDAESICEKLNEQNEELIGYCNFSLHDVLDKKNKENEQLKKENEKLTKALLFFMDVTYVETSSNWYESMDTACQKIFEKSYDEIHKIYKGIGTDEEVFKLFEGDVE